MASLAATLCTKLISSVHLRRDGDDFVISGVAPNFSAQRLDFGAQARGFERVLNGDAQFVEIERLADEVVSAQLERVLDVVQLRIGRDHDDRRRVGSSS